MAKNAFDVKEDIEQFDDLSFLFHKEGKFNQKDRLIIWILNNVFKENEVEINKEAATTKYSTFHNKYLKDYLQKNMQNKEFTNPWLATPNTIDANKISEEIIVYFYNLEKNIIVSIDKDFISKLENFKLKNTTLLSDSLLQKKNKEFKLFICEYILSLSKLLNDRTFTKDDWVKANVTNDLQNKIIEQPLFSYKLNTYYFKQQLIKTQESNDLSKLYPKSKFLDDEVPTNDIYFRKASEPKSLYTFDEKTKKEIRVDRSGPIFEAVTKTDKCVGLREDIDVDGNVTIDNNAPANKKLSCYKFLLECLTSNDKDSIKQCKVFMTQKEYWDNIKTEIYTEMLPAIAIDLLEKFGFVRVSVEDSVAKRKLIKFENVESWLSNLQKKVESNELTKAEFEAIQRNDKLIAYLKEVVKKINTSPAILNEDYVGSSEDALPYNPNKFAHTYFGKILKPRLIDNSSTNYVRRLSGVLNTNLDSIKIRLNPIIVGTNGSTYIQAGGYSSEELLSKKNSIEFRNLYKSLIEQLNSENKQIAPEDKKDIELTLANFERTENKLYKIISLINKYIEMITVFRHNDPDNILTADHLEEFLKAKDKIIEKVEKKQTNLVSILSTLAETVSATDKKLDTILKKTPETVSSSSVPPTKITYNN